MYSWQKYIQYCNIIVYLNYKENPVVFTLHTLGLVRCLCVLKVSRGLWKVVKLSSEMMVVSSPHLRFCSFQSSPKGTIM